MTETGQGRSVSVLPWQKLISVSLWATLLLLYLNSGDNRKWMK